MRAFRALPVLFVGLILAACTSKSAGNPAVVDAGPGDVTCQTDPRAQTYTANMEQMGASGSFKFVLVEAVPSPPLKGTNTWTLKLTDASKTNVAGATIDILPFMPDHGHGTSVAADATANPDGTYKITPLYLFMPGIWRVTLTAHAGAVTDTAEFLFCIEG